MHHVSSHLAATLLTALLALGVLQPAQARPLTEDEAEALDKAVSRYLSASGSKNAEGIVAAIPPRVLNVFAGAYGIEAKNLDKTLIEQTAAMMKQASFSDLTSDQTALDAADVAMADGTAVTWVIVPTAFTAETKGNKTRNEQPLLALNEGGKWYFMRIEGEEVRKIVAFAYPFLAEAVLPEARVTPIP
ncbi:MAG: hypothetical protein ACKVPY_10565 [Paracoccaceae bacterium]